MRNDCYVQIEHEASCSFIFPKIGKVSTVDQFIADVREQHEQA
ncbi:hypothetical protein ABTW76_11460 [Paenibacillus dendritiformis]